MSGEGQCARDLSLQFRIPHSALRIRNYRPIALSDGGVESDGGGGVESGGGGGGEESVTLS